MNSRQRQLLHKIDNKILSQDKIIKKLKKYPEQKTKISFLDIFSMEFENKKIVEYYEKYSQISKLVKIKKFL